MSEIVGRLDDLENTISVRFIEGCGFKKLARATIDLHSDRLSGV